MLPLMRRGFAALALSFAVLAPIALFHAAPASVAAWRDSLFDSMASYLGGVVQATPATPVRLVAIDDESIARVGPWPWTPQAMEALRQHIRSLGARKVIFDPKTSSPTAPEAPRLGQNPMTAPLVAAGANGPRLSEIGQMARALIGGMDTRTQPPEGTKGWRLQSRGYRVMLPDVHGTPVWRTNAAGELRLLPATAPTGLQDLPAWRVASDAGAAAQMKGAIALVARVPTPATGSPAWTRAQTIAQLVNGLTPAQPPWALALEAVGAMLASLGVALLMLRRRTLMALGAAVLAGLLFTGVATALFVFRLDLIDPVSPLVLVVGSLLLSGAAVTLSGTGEPSRARAGAKGVDRREVTALVLTIRDMPALIDTYEDEPAAIARIVGKLFGTAAEIASAHRGIIEQVGPDRLVAVFGGTDDHPRHAEKAAEAALAMLSRLEPINESLAKALSGLGAFSPLQISIGIATADAIVGPLVPGRRSGTMLGPALDIAAHLAADAERYGPAILVSGRTQDLANRTFAMHEIDRAEFAGGKQDAIFALLGNPVLRVNPKFKALQEGFTAFHAAYRKGSWEQAGQLLAHCAKLPGAAPKLIGLYQRRLQALASGPPIPNWNGILRPQID